MKDTETDDLSETISETGTYRTTFTDSVDSASEAVISAVATLTGEDPVEMPPLYTAIDPDALDALFRPTRTGPRRGDRRLEFAFNGHEVTVKSCGVIVVDPLEEIQL